MKTMCAWVVALLMSAAMIGCGGEEKKPDAKPATPDAAKPADPAATPADPAATPADPAATPADPAKPADSAAPGEAPPK